MRLLEFVYLLHRKHFAELLISLHLQSRLLQYDFSEFLLLHEDVSWLLLSYSHRLMTNIEHCIHKVIKANILMRIFSCLCMDAIFSGYLSESVWYPIYYQDIVIYAQNVLYQLKNVICTFFFRIFHFIRDLC